MTKISKITVFLCAQLLISTAQVNEPLSRSAALQRNGNLQAARTGYEKALETANADHDEIVSAAALAGLARVDLELGHYADSIAEAGAALTRFREQKKRAEAGQILTTLAQARFFSGDAEAALGDLNQALDLARETGDRENEITRLNNIGNVYYSQGRYSEALQRYQLAQERVAVSGGEKWFGSRRQLTAANMAVLYQKVGQYQRALQLYNEMGVSSGALPTPERAQMLSNMGTLYRRLGDPVKALEMYRTAQALYHRSSSLSGEVGVLDNIGIAQTLDFKNPNAAVNTFTEALLMAGKSGAKRLRMTSLLYRGEALLRAGQLRRAETDFEETRKLADLLNAGEEKWKADYGLARAADAQGRMERSNALLREGVEIIERLRKSSSTPSGRTGFLIERRGVYDLLIEHEAAGSAPNAASIFGLMEQSRARNLQDRLKPKPSSLEDLRVRVPPGTLILEYWLGEHSMAVIWISNERVGLVYRAVSEAGNTAIRDLPLALADPKRRDWDSLAGAAAGILLDGVDAITSASLRRIIVVPDGELARIPFEVLPAQSQSPNLLIDRATISYLPFGSAFHSGAESRRLFAPWKKTLVAFANPASGAPNKGLSPGGENQWLPASEVEVRNAAEAVGGRSDLHLGLDARKQYLMRPTDPAPLLHFATHAFADPQDPERSYILLSSAQQDQGFDYLFLKEAASLPAANGTLVTVSACDSGSGKSTRGEGVESFGSAFLAAGARAVVTSLWRIGDRPSAELMARFYGALADGTNASDALRDAKLAFRRSGTSSAHPSYWAAFVLTGEGDFRVPRVISWKLVTAAASVSLFGLLVAAMAGLRGIRKAGGTG